MWCTTSSSVAKWSPWTCSRLAFGASPDCIGNIGPSVGLVGPTENNAFMPETTKWFLLMVLRRVEIYTVIILFVPEFWRK